MTKKATGIKAILKSIAYVGLLMTFVFPTALLAQSSIKGKVTDSEGRPLAGANVYIKDIGKGDVSDTKGHFSINGLQDDTYDVTASYFGFETVTESVSLDGDTKMNFTLTSTSILGQEVIIEVNRAQDRRTPVAFTTVGRDDISKKYTTQDVPDLLKNVPGVYTSSAGLGESEIFIRGFDAERIQILINGVPVNDPESQVVYWSNWTGLSGNASSIQVQRGVGSSLVGSGAFGGSVNIQTSRYSATRAINFRTSVGFYNTQGAKGKNGKIADGTGGFDTYDPSNQMWAFDYTSGLLQGGKLNLFFRYERKAGDSYITGTDYNGHSFYFGAQSILGNHLLTLNAHGAPQRHNQSRKTADVDLLDRLGREYNRNNHPYQENYFFKPQFELHDNWTISDNQVLQTNLFTTFGTGGGRYLRNDDFDVNTGINTFKPVSEGEDWYRFGRNARFIHENTGVILTGYTPIVEGSGVFTYGSISDTVTASATELANGDFNHSWRNDSQNDHIQFGLNSSYQNKLNKYLTVTVGGEARYWKAAHTAQSFDFRRFDVNDDIDNSDVQTLEQVQRRYNYDGIVTNLSGFGRLLITPIEPLTLMVDGQFARYSSKVEENPVKIFDYAAGTFTNQTYLTTKDKVDTDGTTPLFKDSDYERDFTFFMPKFGANYNITPEVNVFGNYSISKKEPKVGDWYSRSSGPGTSQPTDANGDPLDLDEETLTNIEFGAGYSHRYFSVKANYYIMTFEDKIESVTNQNGDRVTMNAGEAEHKGIELEAAAKYNKFDANISATLATNEWTKMNVDEIFGEDVDDVVGKTVPFAPETMISGGAGYSPNKNWHLGLSFNHWDNYFMSYTNDQPILDANGDEIGRESTKLPVFFELNAHIAYTFNFAGSDILLRLDLNNITSREQFQAGDWTRDFNRNDQYSGEFRGYVVQSPLFSTFFTAQVAL